MFFTLEKLDKQTKELEEYRFREEFGLDSFRSREDQAGEIGRYPDENGEWHKLHIGEDWIGWDKYVWLAAEVDLPAEWMGKTIVGRFDFGITNGGNTAGFESLLFLDGAAYQGVDNHHREVFFPADRAGQRVSLQFRLWSGLNGYGKREPLTHRLRHAGIAWLDEITDDLYYTARAVVETVRVLPETSPDRHELLRLLDRSFRQLDWSRPGSDDFYASIGRTQDELKAGLSAMPKHHPVIVRCIGHTHIDVAWLWQLRHTREKAARSFSTVLRMMERYPEYVFLQTQPQLYEYIKSDYPDLYREIQQRVGESRWEAGGAMWLEADCNLTSGESLVRQILYGKRFFAREFGVECRYLWLPDVFGYSLALPQILVKSGIEAFMTTKISWNQYNRMPHDTFYWRGMDGTRILTHFITTPDGAGEDIGKFFFTYNGKITPKTVSGIWDAYQDKEFNNELLLAYGYGDGGGGVNREMLEMRRRLADMPGLPQVTTGRADEYFTALRGRVESTEQYVHTWDGELYLELHRGTYTSQAYVKRMNRKLELLYRETEWISVLGSVLGKDWSVYRQSELYEGWKIILRNQFHDIIPGSSIAEVYEDCRQEYDEAERIGQAQWNRAAQTIVRDSGLRESIERKITVWNSSPWLRSDDLVLPLEEFGGFVEWKDEGGNRLTAQRGTDGVHIRVEHIPPMGYMVLTGSGLKATDGTVGAETSENDSESASRPFLQIDQGLITPFYEIAWNSQGQLTRIFDRAARREVLADGECGNVWQVFEDKPKSRHEAWDIDMYYQQKMRQIDQLKQVAVVETGPLCTVVCFEWLYLGSTIRQNMILYTHCRRIDFQTMIDWHEQRQLLKVAFPVQVRSTSATYDIQFGNVQRPTHWNTSWDYAKFETVGHQWADLSERNYGVSLLNDCKYGYDIKDHVIRLTLIKSAQFPDPEQDQGKHLFTYALLPHADDWYKGRTVQEAWSLNNPLTFSNRMAANKGFSLFRLSEEYIMIDAVKKAEDRDCIVIRLHEFAGMRGDVQLGSDLPLRWWQECDLMEQAFGEYHEGEPVALHFSPYEIKTLLIGIEWETDKTA